MATAIYMIKIQSIPIEAHGNTCYTQEKSTEYELRADQCVI